MNIKDLNVGFGLTGSYCTIAKVLPVIEEIMASGARVIPVINESMNEVENRFGCSREWKRQIENITGERILETIEEVEPLGPNNTLDIFIIAPCTGNTMAKLSRGITDSPVLMTAKLQFRNCKPVLAAISTNDGLGINAISLGYLLNFKHVFMVPFAQDSPEYKPNSLVARMDLVIPAMLAALENRQMQPIICNQ